MTDKEKNVEFIYFDSSKEINSTFLKKWTRHMEEFYRHIKTIGKSQISNIVNYIYICTANLKKKKDSYVLICSVMCVCDAHVACLKLSSRFANSIWQVSGHPVCDLV